MQLNHLNLSVKDVQTTRIFFETYFDFRCTDSKPNDKLSVLNGKDGFVLVLMHEQLNQKGNSTYPDMFHLGFYLEDEEAVNNTYQRLLAGGILPGQAPQRIRKNFGFYFTWDTFMIEITTPVKD